LGGHVGDHFGKILGGHCGVPLETHWRDILGEKQTLMLVVCMEDPFGISIPLHGRM